MTTTKHKNGGSLSKPVILSPALAAIVSTDPLPRIEVVSKIWNHIRMSSLQDPADKRTIVADDKLSAKFGQDRCTMFEIKKLISPHLKAA